MFPSSSLFLGPFTAASPVQSTRSFGSHTYPSPGVCPQPKKKKPRLPSFVLQHKHIAVNNLLRSLNVDFAGLANILPLRHRRLPSCRLPAVHLGHHSTEGHRSRSRRGPHRIAIRMVAMGMRVKDKTNRLLRQAFHYS